MFKRKQTLSRSEKTINIEKYNEDLVTVGKHTLTNAIEVVENEVTCVTIATRLSS